MYNSKGEAAKYVCILYPLWDLCVGIVLLRFFA